MNRDKRKIFGQAFVDIMKYVFTIIVIGNIFSEKINIAQTIVGTILAIIMGFVAYKLIPKDKEE
jgi:hypothetical protein